ncbi:hypothetical protein K3495_g17452, partial [Podosphaera aphanis]
MTDIQNFVFEDGFTVCSAWDKLKDLRRKLGAGSEDAKKTYSDAALFLILSRALPKSFGHTVDGLDLHVEMSVEEKIKHLEAKELKLQYDHESAHLARGPSYVPPHRRSNWNRRES